jgi:hypothetical protein
MSLTSAVFQVLAGTSVCVGYFLRRQDRCFFSQMIFRMNADQRLLKAKRVPKGASLAFFFAFGPTVWTGLDHPLGFSFGRTSSLF